MKIAPIPCLVLAALAASAALAQTQVPTVFPEGAQPPAAQALHERLAGKIYTAEPASGPSWRLQFQGTGWMFINLGNGASDKGRWRTEDGRLCVDYQRFPSGCNEVRTQGEALYLQRSSGEVVLLRAQ